MFINLISPDGGGKDTQKELLLPYFPNALVTFEPGGTIEANIIRDVLLNKDLSNEQRILNLIRLTESPVINEDTQLLLQKAIEEMKKNPINGIAEMYLYTASRSESLEKAIRPALLRNQHVVGNRSVACSVAYQGNGRELGMERVWSVNEPIVAGTYPDLEIFLDIPISVTTERLAARKGKQDRLDKESIQFHEKTREGYLYFYKNICPYNYAIVDATGTIEEVHQNLLSTLRKHEIVNSKKQLQ